MLGLNGPFTVVTVMEGVIPMIGKEEYRMRSKEDINGTNPNEGRRG
jgi:hypothetical protein